MFNKISGFLFVLGLLGAVGVSPPAQSQISFMFSVRVAPPAIPIHDLPETPGDGYIWTPGYWSWDSDFDEYYWVPGTWVRPPRVGYYWTPGYWGWRTGSYNWYPGYWGPRVGYYGGINYGWGYFGSGFSGGNWFGDRFIYRPITRNYWGNRYSYNGPGGVRRAPSRYERSFAQQTHMAPLSDQLQHERAARALPDLRASVNRGQPPIKVTRTPGAFVRPANDNRRPGSVKPGERSEGRQQGVERGRAPENIAPPSTTSEANRSGSLERGVQRQPQTQPQIQTTPNMAPRPVPPVMRRPMNRNPAPQGFQSEPRNRGLPQMEHRGPPSSTPNRAESRRPTMMPSQARPIEPQRNMPAFGRQENSRPAPKSKAYRQKKRPGEQDR